MEDIRLRTIAEIIQDNDEELFVNMVNNDEGHKARVKAKMEQFKALQASACQSPVRLAVGALDPCGTYRWVPARLG